MNVAHYINKRPSSYWIYCLPLLVNTINNKWKSSVIILIAIWIMRIPLTVLVAMLCCRWPFCRVEVCCFSQILHVFPDYIHDDFVFCKICFWRKKTKS